MQRNSAVAPGADACPRQLSEEYEEMFDSNGASTECLRCLGSIEEKLRWPPAGSNDFELGPPERRAAVSTIVYCVKVTGIEPRKLFEAVALFDAFLGKVPTGFGMDHVAAATVAAVRIVHKTDKVNQVIPAQFGSELVSQLRALGHHVQECSEESVCVAERSILAALKWQVNLPSVTLWVEKFAFRLCALTENKMKKMFDELWKFCHILTSRLLWLKEPSAPMPPRAEAAGALGLGLACVGLLPAGCLRPTGAPEDLWQDAVAALQAFGACPPSDFGGVPSHYASQMLSFYVLPALDCSMEQLQGACWQVLSTLACAHQQQLNEI